MTTINTIALIPARSGSKRIPNKNLAEIDGEPAVLRTLKLTISSGLFSKIFISTDSREIEILALENGAKSLGLRNIKYSNDFATTLEVVKYEIGRIESSGITIESLCCVYPVTPLLSIERIRQGFDLLSNTKEGFVFPVQRFNKVAIKAKKENNLVCIENDIYNAPRTQDLDELYVDAGQFYWGNRSHWLEKETIFSANSNLLVLDKWETIDIDDLEDLELARVLYSSRKSRIGKS